MDKIGITSLAQRTYHKRCQVAERLSTVYLNADAFVGDAYFAIAEQKMYNYENKHLSKKSTVLKSAKKAFGYYRKKYGKDGVSAVVHKYITSLPFMRLRVFQRLMFSSEELLDDFVESVAEASQNTIKKRSGAKIVHMLK